MELRGKVAIVTGGAVRLGRAISLALAGEGMCLAVHHWHSETEADETIAAIQSAGGRAIHVRADLNHPVQAAQDILGPVLDEFGRVDVLINNAAIFEPGTISTTTVENWQRHFTINLESAFFLCQRFVDVLTAEQTAHIVNIADHRAMRPRPGHLAYTLSKAGLVTLTQLLALELAPRVQVNAIAPGAILPPPDKDAAYLRRLAELIPLKRSGSPGEITEAVLFLLRSDFITGEILHITGGEHL